MTNLEREIQARTERFVAELAELIKRAALETVNQALAGGGAQASRRGASAPAPAAGRVVRGGRPAAAKGRKKGEKRSAEQLDDLVESLFAEVKKSGGRGVEAMS